MTKEYLKKLEYLGDYTIGDCTLRSHKYYKELYNYLEAIDNVESSEALKCLESIMLYSSNYYDGIYKFEKEFNTIKQALLKTKENARSEEILQKYYQEGITLDSVRTLKQERDNYKKALEIIREKNVWVARLKGLFKKYSNDLDVLRIYNANMPSIDYQLTEEEYETIKEVLE